MWILLTVSPYVIADNINNERCTEDCSNGIIQSFYKIQAYLTLVSIFFKLLLAGHYIMLSSCIV